MRRTADETARLLAAILNRSGQNRARVSAKTIKLLAKRETLRSAFIEELKEFLPDYSWVICEIESGGYGAIRAKLLEAAKPVTARKWLRDDERRKLKDGSFKFSALDSEIMPEDEAPDDDE
jgi:hypothetical protein